MSDEEEIAKELAEIRVDQLLVSTASMLASLAALHLADEQRDLEQAKLAIDAIKALQRPLQDFLEDDAKRQLNGLVANLQMAYVNAVVPASAAEAQPQPEAQPDAPDG